MTQRIESIEDLADLVRDQRKALGMTQVELAGACGLGPRFIGDIERAKPTCEIGKTLRVLTMLGIEIQASSRADSE
jgi:HTH-type transcriptional regulator/antitoxin HipB